MDNFVITIARQYGSGGRTVGEMLAKKLGIGYYDKDIIRMASEDSGIHETLFGRVDEYSSARKPLFGKNGIYSGELIPPQRILPLMRTCLIFRRRSSVSWQKRSPA